LNVISRRRAVQKKAETARGLSETTFWRASFAAPDSF